MNILKKIIALVAIICVYLYYKTDQDIYFAIFLASMVVVLGDAAINSFKDKKYFLFAISLAACLASLILVIQMVVTNSL